MKLKEKNEEVKKEVDWEGEKGKEQERMSECWWGQHCAIPLHPGWAGVGTAPRCDGGQAWGTPEAWSGPAGDGPPSHLPGPTRKSCQ